ncbi:MAG: serine--tRNA ligase [Candidatus Yanofskybacteria bacterium CG10_big_fil_rev_8_21_14_0_10_46_23]|uniref:Serine--tRNA ligase n=1 Tax=Candidatus Yanofskybacteria bacterium CG10_big_fil_rev_8_21_14_0_10_46_23 TaxID=1975098 RepID=A0A2H0R5X5_9BACT|nr:MAG: serine--tRNA ligase [Candidatus Yanofskybacteria bacterium CG10_big_fil_rev_8_21_14_0_10_46_23]
MLDIKFIRENFEFVKKAAHDKGCKLDFDKLLKLDKERRDLLGELEKLRANQNKGSKAKPTPEEQGALKNNKQRIQAQEKELEGVTTEFDALMLKIPNPAMADVPVGKDEADNQVIRKWGEPREFKFRVRDHVELGEILDVIDIDRATKVSGARSAYLKGGAVKIQFALVQFVFEALTNEKTLAKIIKSMGEKINPKPFVPVVPPVIIKPEPFRRMARLSEADKDERYYLQQDDKYLVGSAEHTLGSMFMDEIIDERDLPIRFLGYSTSFRREAGSYGKDTRGILRVHQFDKLEMESFTVGEDSLKEHNFFVAIQEYLMQQLDIPYQVILVSTGDMGGPDAHQVDIEAWIPGQNKYRETHTADLMTDYQARRLQTRVRRLNGQIEVAHTNDATAFAIGRILIAILENNQEEDGSVRIPKILQKYLGQKVIRPPENK